MKNGKTNKKIIFAGRYNQSEILPGPEKVAKRIFHEYIKHNESIFIQYFFDGRKYNYFKKLFGKEIIQNLDGSYIIALGIFRMLLAVYKCKPDIIHLINFERFSIILFLFKLRKTKFIYNLHGIVSFENDIKKLPFFYKLKDRICEKYYFKHSDIIVCPSEKYAALSHKYYDFNDEKIRIIPHGCSKEFYSVNRIPRKNSQLNLAIQSYKTGFENSKEFLNKILENVDFKINLFVITNREKPFEPDNTNLNVICKRLMETKNFAEFLGGIDLFLSLYKYDTFSITVIEAMAAGAVPIVTEETGMSTYITNGVNGYKSFFGDEKYFLNIIEYLSNNKDKIKELSDNARRIYNKLNWENVYNMYSILYQKISS